MASFCSMASWAALVSGESPGSWGILIFIWCPKLDSGQMRLPLATSMTLTRRVAWGMYDPVSGESENSVTTA